jgi:hypothetical protein
MNLSMVSTDFSQIPVSSLPDAPRPFRGTDTGNVPTVIKEGRCQQKPYATFGRYRGADLTMDLTARTNAWSSPEITSTNGTSNASLYRLHISRDRS